MGVKEEVNLPPGPVPATVVVSDGEVDHDIHFLQFGTHLVLVLHDNRMFVVSLADVGMASTSPVEEVASDFYIDMAVGVPDGGVSFRVEPSSVSGGSGVVSDASIGVDGYDVDDVVLVVF